MKRIRFDTSEIASVYDHPTGDQWFQAFLKIIGSGKVQRVLDIGCGPAWYTRTLSQGLGTVAIGVDFSWQMLQTAAERHRDETIHLVRGQAVSLPLQDKCVDLILMRYLIHHIEDKASAIHEACRLLRPGGRLVIETSDPEFLKRSDIYDAVPRMIDVDIPRWPAIPYLEQLAFEMGCVQVTSHERTIHKGWQDVKAHLDIAKERARTGTGSSFWQLLTEKERWAFYHRLKHELPKRYPNGNIPREWTSTFVMGKMT